jgi:ankyrin repeat protein
MMRSNKPNPIEERLAVLHQGPRMKSQATVDFEIVLKAFIAENPPSFVVNRLQEIEVTIDQQIYNLCKILEHHPDFEHINFDSLDAKQNAFATDQLRKLTSYATVDTSEISEAEARAIYYYSMSTPKSASFEKINRFLRENGKISDLNDIQTMMIVIGYYSKAMLKLRTLAQDKFENKTREDQQVFRGENYKTPRLAKAVADKRTQALTREAGFFSTSQQKAVSESFTRDNQRLNQQNLLIELRQEKDVHGVDIARHSMHQHEQEVGFTPGASFVYVKPNKHDNTLIAVPVRSIDDIYFLHYQRQLIDIRTQMLRHLDIYAKEPGSDSKLIKTVERFCQNIFNYNAAEMVNTYLACKEAQTIFSSLDAKLNAQAFNYYSAAIQSIKQAAEAAVRHEFSIVNAELLKATQYAYDHHYKNAYTQPEVASADLSLTIDGVTIKRPNHGMAHVLRKALYIPIIYQLFLSHAKDSEFKDALSNLSAEQLKLIQIAILFSVSGRESELGVVDSKQSMAAYLAYRKKSKANFMEYMKLEGYHHPDKDNEFIETLAEQVKYFGNPEFLIMVALRNPQPQKVCIYNIMNLAHNLELLRCYTLGEIGPRLANIESVLVSFYLNEAFSEHGMPVLLTMANDCLVATGDRQFVAPHNGKLVDVSRSYTSAFITSSTDATACMKACMLANPVFVEMIFGKSDLTSSANKLKLTLLHEAFMSADIVGINTVVNDPEFKFDEMSAIQILLVDIFWGHFDSPVLLNALLNEITTNDDCDPADLTAALHVAINKKREDIALALIAKGADLCSVDKMGRTPLISSINMRLTQLSQEMIKRSGEMINMADDNHTTPINHARAVKCWTTVRKLIRSPNIDLGGETGIILISDLIKHLETDLATEILMLHKNLNLNMSNPVHFADPLTVAIKYCNTNKHKLMSITKALVDYGMKVTVDHIKEAIKSANWDAIRYLVESTSVDVDYSGYWFNVTGQCSLMNIACNLNDERLVQALIKRGARCDIDHANGSSSVIELCIEKHSPFSTLLISALPSYNPPPSSVIMRNIMHLALLSKDEQLIEHTFTTLLTIPSFQLGDCDHMILLTACGSGNLPFVKRLLGMIEDSSALLLRIGNVLIEAAAKSDSDDLIDYLLDHGAVIHPDTASSLVPVAAIKRNIKQMKRWLSIPNVRLDADICNMTALATASVTGQYEMAELLIRHNVVQAVTVGNNKDNAPLLCAIRGNHPDLINLLIKSGVSTSKSFLKRNPITYAITKGNELAAMLLLTIPAIRDEHISQADDDGDTPLSLAVAIGNSTLVKSLLQNGADPNVPASHYHYSGRVPVIVYAARAAQWEIVDRLLNVDRIETHHYIKERTLLELACKHNIEAIVKKILQVRLVQIKYGKLDLRFAKEDTTLSLSIATASENKNIIDLLTQHNTDLNAVLSENVFNPGLATHSTLFSKNPDSQQSNVMYKGASPG